MSDQSPASFDEFWRHYQSLHRHPANRALHGVGTALAVSLLGYALLRRRFRLLPFIPLVGYMPAWLGHLVFERNRPASFTHPLWSLLANFRMLGRMITPRAKSRPEDAMPRLASPDSTLALLLDPYHFVSKRAQRLGSEAFRGRLLLRPTIFLGGEDAARLFYDPDKFMRAGAMPEPVLQTLLGDVGVQTLDNERHRHRKAMFLSLLTGEGVARLTAMTEKMWLDHARRWAAAGERVVLYDAMQTIITHAVCEWAGVPLSDDELPKRRRQLVALFDKAANLGHVYSRIQRNRAEAWAAALIADVRRGERTAPPGSALELIANHREADGQRLNRRTAAVELLNVLRPAVAVSVYITFIAHALHEHPEHRRRLETGELGFARSFAQEVRRWYPFFPSVTARVRHDFEWKGYTFKTGTRVVFDLHGTNHDPQSWTSPDTFDPDRFQKQHAESGATESHTDADEVTAGCPFRLVPQGGGHHATGHRCPGEWITLALMTMAARVLTTRLDYNVPPQDLRIDDTRLPAIPRSRFVIKDIRVRAEHEAESRTRAHRAKP